MISISFNACKSYSRQTEWLREIKNMREKYLEKCRNITYLKISEKKKVYPCPGGDFGNARQLSYLLCHWAETLFYKMVYNLKEYILSSRWICNIWHIFI